MDSENESVCRGNQEAPRDDISKAPTKDVVPTEGGGNGKQAAPCDDGKELPEEAGADGHAVPAECVGGGERTAARAVVKIAGSRPSGERGRSRSTDVQVDTMRAAVLPYDWADTQAGRRARAMPRAGHRRDRQCKAASYVQVLLGDEEDALSDMDSEQPSSASELSDDEQTAALWRADASDSELDP